jgi:hypothetical protein
VDVKEGKNERGEIKTVQKRERERRENRGMRNSEGRHALQDWSKQLPSLPALLLGPMSWQWLHIPATSSHRATLVALLSQLTPPGGRGKPCLPSILSFLYFFESSFCSTYSPYDAITLFLKLNLITLIKINKLNNLNKLNTINYLQFITYINEITKYDK